MSGHFCNQLCGCMQQNVAASLAQLQASNAQALSQQNAQAMHFHQYTIGESAAARAGEERGRKESAKRIYELEAERDEARKYWQEARARSNRLADECGRLRDENRELLAENARLRRGAR